jgi:Flp pilus assembly protein TadG
MMQFMKRCSRAFRREEGTGTVELVLVVPMLFSIFMMSFESGLMMIRSVMLDRATDLTMRELRLGHYTDPDTDLLKDEICNRTSMITDCDDAIMIEMQVVDQTTWALPAPPTRCRDRSLAIQMEPGFSVGTQNELMLVRVCVLQRAIFPTTGLGDGLSDNTYGEYGLVSVSTFVNEPS